jgi:hypothetical protein
MGGIGALTWNIVQPGTGTLPLGLSLSPTGAISGTPIAPAGPSNFTVRVQDAGGQVDTQELSITITIFSPPNITTNNPLPGGTVGQTYNQTLQATGGFQPYTWSVPPGSLPAGLTLSQAGTISGVPTNEGTSNFTVTVTDAFNQSATKNLSIIVSAVLEITTPSMSPNPKEGQAYAITLQKSGGLDPVSWSVKPNLPDGLTLSQAGEISGIPGPGTGSGVPQTFTFTVQDSTTPTPQTATKALDLTIDPP